MNKDGVVTKEPALEEVFEQLEEVLSNMQTEASLEKSFQLYHQGIELVRACNDRIDKIEKQIKLLDEEGETHDFM